MYILFSYTLTGFGKFSVYTRIRYPQSPFRPQLRIYSLLINDFLLNLKIIQTDFGMHYLKSIPIQLSQVSFNADNYVQMIEIGFFETFPLGFTYLFIYLETTA